MKEKLKFNSVGWLAKREKLMLVIKKTENIRIRKG